MTDPPPAKQSARQERTEKTKIDDLLVRQSDSTTPEISIVMPTLNEEEGISECIRQAKNAILELGIPAEIILSDSSTDRTPEIGRDMGAIVYEPDRNGYGYAYRYAFARARGEYIVMGDADTTYDFEQIPRLLAELQESDADIVMGSRLQGEIKPSAMPMLHQYIGNPVLTGFLNLFYDTGVSDAHSGFRIFTREALETMDLKTNGMEFASEMIMEASAKNLKIVEIPIVYHERKGEETLSSFQDGWRHIRFMLANAPGYLFSIPGIVIGALGLLLTAVAWSDLGQNVISFEVHLIIAGSLLTIVGYQVFSLGVFTMVASNPIRRPDDGLTKLAVRNMTLERGATAGCFAFGFGIIHASFLSYQWMTSGFDPTTFTKTLLVAFTLIVIGLQTIFFSFFFDLMRD